MRRIQTARIHREQSTVEAVRCGVLCVCLRVWFACFASTVRSTLHSPVRAQRPHGLPVRVDACGRSWPVDWAGWLAPVLSWGSCSGACTASAIAGRPLVGCCMLHGRCVPPLCQVHGAALCGDGGALPGHGEATRCAGLSLGGQHQWVCPPHATSAPGLGHTPCQICTGTRLTRCHICTGTGLSRVLCAFSAFPSAMPCAAPQLAQRPSA